MAEVEFWYEFASTYSYPAAMRAAKVAGERGIRIIWRPFLLGPIFGALGWKTSPFNLQPAKGAYMWRDMKRTCEALELPFQRPGPFPQNGLLAARLALALPDDGTRADFSRAVYQAQFGLSAEISETAVLKGILSGMGQNPDQLLANASSDPIKAQLREATETAQAHGIFGAPTWRTSDGEIFWGNDRLEDALRWEDSLSAGTR